MAHWMLSLKLVGLAIVVFSLLWAMRKSERIGWLYLLASICIMLVTAALLIWTPDAYMALGGTTFFPKNDERGGFDTQSYGGFLQVLFGVPVAIAGSLYAILLARQSERQSRQFNEYEIRKNFRDRLDQRSAVVGRFAKSLRDINNTSFIIVAQVERVIAALPEDETGREHAAVRIGKELAQIDDTGLPMLRTALDDYRNAAIAVQENSISLTRAPTSPLDAIKDHFFRDSIDPQDFINSVFSRDYQAIADRMLIRSVRLSASDMIRAHLERLSQSIVRWSQNGADTAGSLHFRDYIMSAADITNADVSGMTDNLGVRFIGPALMRADRCIDAWDFGSGTGVPSRVDLGTAVLIDSILAVPGVGSALHDFKKWDEWRYLQPLIGKSETKYVETLVPEGDRHFPAAFSREVMDVQKQYGYPLDRTSKESKRLARKARLEYNALFYHMPPDWMDAAYDDLAGRIGSATPPARQELIDHLACIAVGIETVRINSARNDSMDAIHHIVVSMDGAVERQFIKLGPAGHAAYRRCLLVAWAKQATPAERSETLKRLEALRAASLETMLTVQLHLDLFDCHLALGQAERAAGHFSQARDIVDGLGARRLKEIRWFGRHAYKDDAPPLEPQAVLLSMWLNGYLMKCSGDFPYLDLPMTETLITMPHGFLPIIWGVLATSGFIRLPGGAQPTVVQRAGVSFFRFSIKPGQGRWEWEPERIAHELARRLDAARQAGNASFVAQLHDEFKTQASERLRVEPAPLG